MPKYLSWYLGIQERIEESKLDIRNEQNCHLGYYRFWCPQNQVRSITLRKLRASWKSEYQPEPKNPPVIWALWSEHLYPPMQGYFHESALPANHRELDIMFEIFKLWLIKFDDPTEVQKVATEVHPNFMLRLPEEFVPKSAQRANNPSWDYYYRKSSR